MISNKQHYIITTTNENELYYKFLPTVYKMWKNYIPNCIFVLGVISDKDETSEFIKRCKNFCDKFYLFKTIKDINDGIQAKTTRMFLASLFDTNICTVVDIDFYILNKEWFLNNINECFTDNKFISIGYNIYKNTPHYGKFPMAMTTGPGYIWKKIINNENLDYYQWIEYLTKLKNPIDNKENPKNTFYNFSDESVLRYFIIRHKDPNFIKSIWINKEREDVRPGSTMRCNKRIDRSEWHLLDLNNLNNNYYIDSQPLRPFDKYFINLLPLLNKMGIKGTKNELFF